MFTACLGAPPDALAHSPSYPLQQELPPVSLSSLRTSRKLSLRHDLVSQSSMVPRHSDLMVNVSRSRFDRHSSNGGPHSLSSQGSSQNTPSFKRVPSIYSLSSTTGSAASGTILQVAQQPLSPATQQEGRLQTPFSASPRPQQQQQQQQQQEQEQQVQSPLSQPQCVHMQPQRSSQALPVRPQQQLQLQAALQKHHISAQRDHQQQQQQQHLPPQQQQEQQEHQRQQVQQSLSRQASLGVGMQPQVQQQQQQQQYKYQQQALQKSQPQQDEDESLANILLSKLSAGSLHWTPSRQNLEDRLESACLESEAHPDPDQKSERARLQERVAQLGLLVVDSEADGNCQFRSVSQQLYGMQDYHLKLREAAVQHMRTNLEYFVGYLGEEFEDYLDSMEQSGTWGDELTLRALSDALCLRVIVITSDQHNWLLRYEPEGKVPRMECFLVYQGHVHYNSVKRVSTSQKLIASLTKSAGAMRAAGGLSQRGATGSAAALIGST